MTSFTITVQDQGVQTALKSLSDRVGNMSPVLRLIGEEIVERTKRRFETSTDPSGAPWKPNSAATMNLFAGGLGASKRKKDGNLNASGRRVLSNKKPLIGHTRDLSRQFVIGVSADSLTITSTPKYAAIQQFGGKAGRGRKITIPARPFLPVLPDGSLYPQEQSLILQSINDYISGLSRS